MHEEKTFQIRFNQILCDEMSKTFEGPSGTRVGNPKM